MADKSQADLFRSTVPPAYTELSDAQRHDWLRLFRSPRIGPVTFRDLLNHFGSARQAIVALESGQFGSKRFLLADENEISRELERAQKIGAKIVAFGETGYPRWLQAVDGAPPILYVKGQLELAQRASVGMVGSRNASGAGLKLARQLSSELGQYGFVLTSGLARGIDHAVHEGALKTGTIAVLGGGLDHIYPAQNEMTYHRIAEQGLLVSERPLGFYAKPKDFPRRNRLISGISLGTIVVEAALRSGSLTTARFASEQGREVFAIPGHPLDPRATGTNKLIQNGASLVTSASDVIEALHSQMEYDRTGFEEIDHLPLETAEIQEGQKFHDAQPLARESNEQVPLNELKERVVELLGPTPIERDALVRLLKCESRNLQIVLLDLDLEGRIEHHGQQRISLAQTP